MTGYNKNFAKPMTSRSDLNEQELRELGIVKQAIIKSLIEASAIQGRTPAAEATVEAWIQYIRRNEEKDWKMWKMQDKPF